MTVTIIILPNIGHVATVYTLVLLMNSYSSNKYRTISNVGFSNFVK